MHRLPVIVRQEVAPGGPVKRNGAKPKAFFRLLRWSPPRPRRSFSMARAADCQGLLDESDSDPVGVTVKPVRCADPLLRLLWESELEPCECGIADLLALGGVLG